MQYGLLYVNIAKLNGIQVVVSLVYLLLLHSFGVLMPHA